MTHVTAPIRDVRCDESTRPGQDAWSPAMQQHARLQGLKVCHLSPIERLRDERAFSRESLPGVAYGLRPVIVGPHSRTEPLQGVEFVSVPKSRNRALRMLNSFRLVELALQQQAALYQVHSPELIPAGLILKFIYKKRVIYDTREDFPSMMLTKTYLPKWSRSAMSKFVSGVERLAARFLDGVITADSGSLRPLAKTGKSQKLVFYNFPNLRYFPETPAPEKAYDLIYRGGLSERAGTYILLESIRLLLNRGIAVRLLLFGYADNPETEESIRTTLHALGIEHLVTLRGMIPHDEMASTLRLGRIAVCPLQSIPKFMNNIPVKVFESWACGLPVIATDLPPIRPFFGGGRLGLLVKPGDSRDLANAIKRLLASPALADECSQKARRVVVERYNTAVEIRKLLSFYERVLAC